MNLTLDILTPFMGPKDRSLRRTLLPVPLTEGEPLDLFHPGLADLASPVGSQEVVRHTHE